MRTKFLLLSAVILLFTSCAQTYIVTFSGSAGGTVSDVGGEFDEGTVISVTAQPDTGYEFQGWSDGSNQNPRTITVTESLNLIAQFSKQQLTVNVNVQGQGSVIDQDNKAPSTYEFGTVISLEAIPEIGYEFQEWSDGSSQNPRTITVTESLNISAIFSKQKFNVEIVIEGEGVVLDQNGNMPDSYDFGTEILLQAQPANGYYFLGWDFNLELDELNPENNIDLQNLIAGYAADYASFLAYQEQSEMMLISYEQIIGDLKSSIDERNIFYSLFEGPINQEGIELNINPIIVIHKQAGNVIRENEEHRLPLLLISSFTVKAKFEKIESLSIFTSLEGGTLSVNNKPKTPVYINLEPYGTEFQITAVPNLGWDFNGWSGELTGNESTIRTIPDLGFGELYTVQGVFKRKDYEVNISIDGEGSVSEEVVVQPSNFTYETQVKLTANPSENWEFIEWSGDVSSVENPIIITIDSSKSITAKFAKKDSDKDGVPDDIDECPDTPEGSLVDELGCPTDLNNNGIPDDLEGDVDNDGVIDYYDECSNTTPGAAVDSKGCAVVDQVFLFSGAVSTVVLNNNVSGTISFSIRNNLDEPIQLESLKVYDGDTGVLRATADRNSNPNLFPTISPGQSHSLQSTFNSFIYLPMYYWRFTYKGQVYEVSKRWSLTSGQSRPPKDANEATVQEWDKKVLSFQLVNN